MMGKYVVLEGIDGSGKTTNSKLLQEWLKDQKIQVMLTKEPTDNIIGQVARRIIREHVEIDQRALALLFASDSLQHQKGKAGIVDRLQNGEWVLSDRSFLSTYSYQMPDCTLAWLDSLHEHCIIPDITFFLDILPEDAMSRLESSRGPHLEKFEKLEELRQIRKNYLLAIQEFSTRGHNILVIPLSSTTPVSEVQLILRKTLGQHFL